jgi:hypothetical protein
MRKRSRSRAGLALVAALVAAGILAAAALASATVLPVHYARQVTRDVAKRLSERTRDAEKFGVAGCERSSDRRVSCTGFVKGHSVDPNATSRWWRCEFWVRLTLTRRSGNDYQGQKVKAEFSAAKCRGPGADYIQRS